MHTAEDRLCLMIFFSQTLYIIIFRFRVKKDAFQYVQTSLDLVLRFLEKLVEFSENLVKFQCFFFLLNCCQHGKNLLLSFGHVHEVCGSKSNLLVVIHHFWYHLPKSSSVFIFFSLFFKQVINLSWCWIKHGKSWRWDCGSKEALTAWLPGLNSWQRVEAMQSAASPPPLHALFTLLTINC